MEHPINIVGPLVFILISGLEISNHFMNLTGLVGDTIVFMYTVDLEIEKKNYGEMEPHSCPEKPLEIINRVRVAEAVYDSWSDYFRNKLFWTQFDFQWYYSVLMPRINFIN